MSPSFGRVVVSLVLSLGLTSVSFAADPRSPFATWFQQESFQRAFRTARESLELKNGTAVQITPMTGVGRPGLETYRFQHRFSGVEIVGGLSVVENAPDGKAEIVFEAPVVELNPLPSLSGSDALRIAASQIGRALPDAKTTLKILPNDDRKGARLVYWVDYPSSFGGRGGEAIVDARTGDLIADLPDHRTIAPIDVMVAEKQGIAIQVFNRQDALGRIVPDGCEILDLSNGSKKFVDTTTCGAHLQRDYPTCQLILDGSLLGVRAERCRAEIKNHSVLATKLDDSAKRAYQNSKRVLEYFLNTHGRNSYDGKGSAARSVVKVGVQYANAAWIPSEGIMIYGGGDGEEMGDLTHSLDVAGHEMTHGVTSQTASFLGMGDSGALDEGYADFFGVMIAGAKEWAVGKGIFLKDPNEALRDLANPSALDHVFLQADGKFVRKPMPKHLSEKFGTFGRTCAQENDFCYVHGNSTILSHALYLMVQKMGRAKAEKIAYEGLVRYLSKKSGFRDAYEANHRACMRFYDMFTCDRVREAFDEVGAVPSSVDFLGGWGRR